MRRFDLVVVGDVNPDLIVSAPELRVEFGQRETLADDATLLLGGSSSITACAASRLGLRVAFVGLVGDDAYGRFCLDEMRAHSVDVDAVVVDRDVPTGLTVIMQRAGDRAIVTVPGSVAALAPRHVDEAVLAAARHVHVGSFFLLDGLRAHVPHLFATVRAGGGTTSLDPNDDPARAWHLDDVLDHCDVLLPNDAEVCTFAALDSVRDATHRIAARVGVVAVTAGSSGAMAARDGEWVEVAAVPVDEAVIVDAVGAGDNFDAGFLYGYLHDWSLDACLRAGVGAAARSLLGRGGTGALGTIDDALAAVGSS